MFVQYLNLLFLAEHLAELPAKYIFITDCTVFSLFTFLVKQDTRAQVVPGPTYQDQVPSMFFCLSESKQRKVVQF